jgi:hypothetical protein
LKPTPDQIKRGLAASYALRDRGDEKKGLKPTSFTGNPSAHVEAIGAAMLDFQRRVSAWMLECFGPKISADRLERGDRLLEEVLELLQSGGYDRGRVQALVDYVWARPVGEPGQEVGGVRVTLSAYCQAHGIDENAEAERELARILQPEVVEKIRAKQAAKAREIPFSPLPSPAPDQAAIVPQVVRVWGRSFGGFMVPDICEMSDGTFLRPSEDGTTWTPTSDRPNRTETGPLEDSLGPIAGNRREA